MKLVTYLYQDKESVGVLTADEATVRPLPFADMNTLIEAPPEHLLSAVEAAESVAAAVDKALAMAGKEDVIVIFGSLSFLGEAEQAVQRGEKDHG